MEKILYFNWLVIILCCCSIEMKKIKTKSGEIEGIEFNTEANKTGVAYLGIPYAKPPTGERRFKPPEPVKPWKNVLPAHLKSKACLQAISALRGLESEKEFNWWIVPKDKTSEDCLYLNIWVPDSVNNDSANKTVMIWIHGGAFEGGSGNNERLDGQILATENNVIVVTINYRLNVFGFLYFDNDDAPGNVGLQDQALAMKWVQENIVNFGGDDKSITVVGENAGAVSIIFHQTIQSSHGLFNRIILESANLTPFDNKTAHKISEEIAKECNCDGWFKPDRVKCLRKVDAKKLVEAAIKVKNPSGSGTKFFPITDGRYVRDHPYQVIADKNDDKSVDVLIGSTKENGDTFLINIKAIEAKEEFNINNKEYHDRIKKILKTDSDNIAHLTELVYSDFGKSEEEQDRRKQLLVFAKDYNFLRLTNKINDLLADRGHHVYRYEFTHHPSAGKLPFWMGSSNWDDMIFVFGLPLIKSKGYTSSEIELSSKVMSYWTNFAKSGNPNGESVGHPSWPKYSKDERRHLRIGLEIEVADARNLRLMHCAFLDNILPKLLETEKTVKQRCHYNIKDSDEED